MAVKVVRASMECDACGASFQVDLDPAEAAPKSIMDEIEEQINTYFDLSIQHGRHLCAQCTRVADGIGDDEYQPTWDEILEAVKAK
jgi:hypothetical protein